MREFAKADTRRSGFTILEVLVAVTIFAMMSTIVFGTLFYTANSVEQLEERAALYHRAGFILNDISRSVTSAYAPYAGTYIDEWGGRDIFLAGGDPFGDGRAGSLSTFTTNPRLAAGAPGAGIAYVSYELIEATEIEDAPGWIADENNPLVLLCDVEPLLSAPGVEDGYFISWALNVSSLNLEYFDGTEWTKEWSYEDQEAFPSAVKVELELTDSSGEIHAYSTIAFVRANAPLEEPPEEALDVEVEEEGEETDEDEGTGEDEGTDEGVPPPPPPDGDGQGIFPETGGAGTFPFG